MRIYLFAGMCGLAFLPVSAETLTNLEGKKIVVEVCQIGTVDATLKVNGKEFIVKLNTMSPESRQLLNKMRLEREQKAAGDEAVKAAAEAAAKGTFEETKSPFQPQVRDTVATFRDFETKANPEPRNQFETQEEYETRLPKPFDNSEVFYFEVAEEASFSYDIEKQRLTLVAGEFKSPDYREHTLAYTTLAELTPLSIHSKIDDKGSHEASNAYGKTVTVSKIYVSDYFLHLTNGKLLPDALKVPGRKTIDRHAQLSLSVTMDRDRAKELGPQLTLVCGVRFIAYAKSAFQCTATLKPTITAPTEAAVFSHGIDAELISLHIIDKLSKDEFARWKQGEQRAAR
jgi:hypothetical protein